MHKLLALPLLTVACATSAPAFDTAQTPDGAAPPLDASVDVSVDARVDTDASDAAPPLSLGLVATSGWQIYPGGGYRYGPSIIIDTDKSLHMWTCSPGANGAWDFIRYRHSTDGGHVWSADVVALQPSPNTRDAYSTCDPGAIKIGAYFYVGYTSTQDSRGTANQLYIGRSTAPSGPFAKWDGKGWTGPPQPIVTYAGDSQYYGVGEPSLVLLGKKLFVYSTYVDASSHTDLSTVDDATVDDWPNHLTPHGHIITRRPGEDSTDIKFVDAFGKFVGVSTFDRFSPNATLVVYQSTDGISFEPGPYRGARVQPGAHNVGISGDPSGHFDVNASSFVSYAYQPPQSAWGDWPTFIDPVTVTGSPWGTPVAGEVSSIVGGTKGDWAWSGPRMWDGDPTTVFSSDSHGAVDVAAEWAMVDLGKSYAIVGVKVTPRVSGYGFPVDFSIQTSTDASAWTDVAGQKYAGYANPGGNAVTLNFASAAQGRYVRLLTAKLGSDDVGTHYLQLAELTPLVAP